MSNPTKPAWGSYADLKRIQREREQRERIAPLPTEAAETGHPQTGHPQTGHPESTKPGTHEPGTQAPNDRAPGHPEVGARVPGIAIVQPDGSGHPGTHEPGTHNLRSAVSRVGTGIPAPVAGESTESPHWPSRQYKTRLNLRFPGDLALQLDEYCRRNALSKQDATEIAIRRLLADDRSPNRAPGHPQTGHPQTGHPRDRVPESAHDHDDEDDDRIIIYQQMTGNRVNARDRAAFAEVRHLHADVVREGIRLSVERAPAPVKSFRYCLGAIYEVAARTGPPPPKRPSALEAPPMRSYDESVLLARAVIRQLRHDSPGIATTALRDHLRTWSSDQGIVNAETVVDAALAAEGPQA